MDKTTNTPETTGSASTASSAVKAFVSNHALQARRNSYQGQAAGSTAEQKFSPFGWRKTVELVDE